MVTKWREQDKSKTKEIIMPKIKSNSNKNKQSIRSEIKFACLQQEWYHKYKSS